MVEKRMGKIVAYVFCVVILLVHGAMYAESSTADTTYNAYSHVVAMCGGGLEKLLPEELLREIITAKVEKNIYSFVYGSN